MKGESFRRYRSSGLCMTDAETTSAGDSSDSNSSESYTSDEDSSSDDEGSGTLRHSKRGEPHDLDLLTLSRQAAR